MRAIVLPGLDGTGRMLTEFVARLSEWSETTVIAYPDDRALAYAQMADFIETRLPTGQPFVMIAESFSGPVATLVAQRRPEGLAGLAYVASFVRRPLPVPMVLARIASSLPLKSRAFQALALPFTHDRWATDAHGVGLAEAIAPVSQGVLASRIGQILSCDCRDEFARLNLPLFYLRPSKDRLVRASNVFEMARLNSELSVQTITGPHFILQTHAEDAAALLGDFIARLSP